MGYGGGEGAYGCKNQGTDLCLESSVRPGICMHEDAPNVSDHFCQAADGNESGVYPGLVSEPEDEVGEQKDGKVCTEKGVCAEIGIVSVNGHLDRAFWGDRIAVCGDFIVVCQAIGSVSSVGHICG